MMSADRCPTDLDAADSVGTVARLLARASDMARDQAATDPDPVLRFLGLDLAPRVVGNQRRTRAFTAYGMTESSPQGLFQFDQVHAGAGAL